MCVTATVCPGFEETTTGGQKYSRFKRFCQLQSQVNNYTGQGPGVPFPKYPPADRKPICCKYRVSH